MKAKDKNSNRRLVVSKIGKLVNIVIEDNGLVGVGDVTLSKGQAINLRLWLNKYVK